MKYFLTFFSITLLLVPIFVFAQFKPLVGIPGVTNPDNFDQYLQAIYATAIGLAALLAVIKIVIAGVKWMVTDIVSSKSDAKKDIQGAVFGLLIILGAVLILNIINPDIGDVNLSFAPAPRPDAVPGGIDLTAITACNSSPETCKFITKECPEVGGPIDVGNHKGPLPDPVYSCAEIEAECLGDFAVSDSGRDAACLTTDAAAATKLAQIASVNCPAGDTCGAESCTVNSDIFDCESSCYDGGGTYYDENTKVCVTSPTQKLAENDAEIDTLLDEAPLRDNLVSDASIITGFSIKAGVSKTYYLIDLPGDQGPAGSAVNNPIINKLTPVCNLVAESEANPEIKVAVVNYNEEPYAGCVRPS